MPRRTFNKDSAKFLAIAVALMLFVKIVVLGDLRGTPSAPEDVPASAPVEQIAEDKAAKSPPSFEMVHGVTIFPKLPDEIAQGSVAPPQGQAPKTAPLDIPSASHPPVSNARSLPAGERPKIVIIIDDMGVNRSGTAAIAALPGPLTLAYLPYARDLKAQTRMALQNGHELMIHVPMEPMNPDLDMGDIALRNDMSAAAIRTELRDKIFPSFTGYQGINNHMGSRLTQNVAAMRTVMAELKSRGLYFVDSRTIAASVAGGVAAEMGVKYATRDVFLDHYSDLKSVRDALSHTEAVARKHGVAVAIGHPKDHTVQALKDWLPTLTAKGFDLVTASHIVKIGAGEGAAIPAPAPALRNDGPLLTAPYMDLHEEKKYDMLLHGLSTPDMQSTIY